MTKSAETTAQEQRGRPFLPGQSGNPAGRPIGTRNKLSADFLGALQGLWQDRGPEMLERVANEDPGLIIKAIVQLVPKEMTLKAESALDSATEDELFEMLQDIRARRARIAQATVINASVGEKAQKEPS